MWSCSLPCVKTALSGLQMEKGNGPIQIHPTSALPRFKLAAPRDAAKLKPLASLVLPTSNYDSNAGSPASSPSSSSSSSTFSVDKTDNHDFSFGTESVDMRTEDARIKTFEKWPVTFLSGDELARNGFYYLGRGDEVRCAFCKVEIMKWVEGDDPAKDHQRWAPQCPFVRKLGSSASSETSSNGRDECGSRAATSSTTPPRMTGPVHPRYASETARLRSFQDWPRCMKQKPEELAEAGFFYTGQGDKTKCFYCDGGLKDWENDDVPWEQHARWFDRCAYVQLVKGREYVQKVMTEACAVPAAEAGRDVAPVRTSTSSSPLDSPENSVDDSKLCKICYAEERNVCFVPCGHVVACAKCALAADKCPMCRRTFQNAVRLYFS
ncbi:hypothetical protein PYW07_003276 [Mythimna separata]|uniref:Inhibitor of apoptosis protein n=1 Tax=Mythimna separata TaxID=271217 RepID=R4WEC7_MYTSE|nr:hypothetical protein PYW07_003276 [Mythimna separata]BAM76810.1 inhibitor of apoptosis protein [Mythimna separata]